MRAVNPIAVAERFIATRLCLRALEGWNSDERLNQDTLLIASNSGVNELLTRQARNLKPASGFFRIGPHPLAPKEVQEGSRLVREITDGTMRNAADRVESCLGRLPGHGLSRGFGHLLAMEYFSDILGMDRSLQMRERVSQYVMMSIVPDDVRRRATSPYSNLPLLRRAFADGMRAIDSPAVPSDLIDVALLLGASRRESAEIFQRLILSTVGFAGASLEWLLFYLARGEQIVEDPEQYARECLRMAAPAWRLTRDIQEELEISGMFAPAGSKVILNIHAASRDPEAWGDGLRFRPARWGEPNCQRQDVVFGKGARACPAQKSALAMLVTFAARMGNGFRVAYVTPPYARPLAGTMHSPPKGLIKLREDSSVGGK